MENLEQIKKNMEQRESLFSEFACKSCFAIRLNEESSDIRGSFQRDVDKIIHTLSYTRYADKTQVYSDIRNDNTSTRMTHVQFVSRASRTIARALNLNEDLCEAISLGHDIGHVPYGHDGERILSKICMERMGMPFAHNIQSVRNLMNVENYGEGKNISIQVLDGILCHNGEKLLKKYIYKNKNKEDFLNDYNNSYKSKEICNNLIPMSLEACVVRISDIIGYIGRDLEDAIEIDIISRDDIPKTILDKLGRNNREIVNTLILDIINNSIGKNYIALSDEIYDVLNELISFNYKNIYLKSNSKDQINEYEMMFNVVFDKCLMILNNNINEYNIYKCFLDEMSSEYKKNNSNERIIIDYIAGMTDNYFINEYNILKKI